MALLGWGLLEDDLCVLAWSELSRRHLVLRVDLVVHWERDLFQMVMSSCKLGWLELLELLLIRSGLLDLG